MKTQRYEEFHKYGCHFYGKLVVVDYTKEVLAKGSNEFNFGRGLPELEQAKKTRRSQKLQN